MHVRPRRYYRCIAKERKEERKRRTNGRKETYLLGYFVAWYHHSLLSPFWPFIPNSPPQHRSAVADLGLQLDKQFHPVKGGIHPPVLISLSLSLSPLPYLFSAGSHLLSSSSNPPPPSPPRTSFVLTNRTPPILTNRPSFLPPPKGLIRPGLSMSRSRMAGRTSYPPFHQRSARDNPFVLPWPARFFLSRPGTSFRAIHPISKAHI